MPKYIDAELLKSEIENTYLDGDSAMNHLESAEGDTLIGKFQVLDIIYDQPTADVEEVIHAHWFITEYEYLNCSHCGKAYYTGADSTKQAKELLENGHVYPYCPFCGAKMDEEDEE